MDARDTPAARGARTPTPHGRGVRVRLARHRGVLPVAYAVAFALFSWWLDRRTLGVASEAYFSAFTVAANALPMLVVAGLLTALTRRPGVAFLLVAALQALVYRASAIKLDVLGDPLGLQDLYFVTRFDPASFALLGQYVQHPARLALALAAALLLVLLAWRVEKPAFRPLRGAQLLLSLVSVALVASLVGAHAPWDRIYRSDTLRPSRFSAMSGILHAGLMSNLVYTHNRNVHTAHAVDVASLRQLFRATRAQGRTAPPDATRPDIVVVLSESFFDPRLLRGMGPLPDNIPNVRAALAAGHGGAMTVPTFGGGTIRTEFEVLTGMPMSAFPEARFPYVSLVRDHIPSLVSHLEKHGYRTVAIHGNAGSFWNRQNAYRAIGFDRFITETGFPAGAPRNGRWLADSAMTDLVLRELSAGGPPKLVLALSMEAHGPYDDLDTTDRAARDAVQVPPGLDAAQALQLRNYLYHTHRADAEFGRLLRAIRARGRPTVLLFFGDHLPGLRGVFNRLGFANGEAATRQQVPWVLLRSDRNAAPDDAPPTRSWMLPDRLLQLAGLEDDPYFALTGAVTRTLPAQSPAARATTMRGVQAAAAARLGGSFDRFWAQRDRAGEAR